MLKSHLGTLFIALAVIVAAALLGNAYKSRTYGVNKITVTGMAEQHFTSDLIVWNANFSRRSTEIQKAYSLIKSDEESIRAYLKKMGLSDTQYVFSSISTSEDWDYQYDQYGRRVSSDFLGYTLRQSLKVESQDLDRVEKVSREITELLDKGIQLESMSPMYYYTRLADLKIDLLAKASEDARIRAETIAAQAGARRGRLLQANMGIFQITGQYSGEDYTWGGAFNITSKKKTASITVRADYEVQ
ncbi:MAG: SIMPL domain-containing protein [Chitinophagales bacterium]|nr:SIMPL domain-containing protein [Chitinophagales bacterium]MDW8392859.1 SIMPL domain-containing protein [Chitinophagales bacterium]